MMFGLLDSTAAALFVNAGHNPPVHLHATGAMEMLAVTGDIPP